MVTDSRNSRISSLGALMVLWPVPALGLFVATFRPTLHWIQPSVYLPQGWSLAGPSPHFLIISSPTGDQVTPSSCLFQLFYLRPYHWPQPGEHVASAPSCSKASLNLRLLSPAPAPAPATRLERTLGAGARLLPRSQSWFFAPLKVKSAVQSPLVA